MWLIIGSKRQGRTVFVKKEPGKLTLEMSPRLMTSCSVWTWA